MINSFTSDDHGALSQRMLAPHRYTVADTSRNPIFSVAYVMPMNVGAITNRKTNAHSIFFLASWSEQMNLSILEFSWIVPARYA